MVERQQVSLSPSGQSGTLLAPPDTSIQAPARSPSRCSVQSRSPSHASTTSSPPRSRRPSDVGLETAAASVALFPGSGTLAAATVGALGSVAAVAAGGVALVGGGLAAAAFKFSPSLNGESSVMSRDERERRLEQLNKATEVSRESEAACAVKEEEEALATVLSAREVHR